MTKAKTKAGSGDTSRPAVIELFNYLKGHKAPVAASDSSESIVNAAITLMKHMKECCDIIEKGSTEKFSAKFNAKIAGINIKGQIIKITIETELSRLLLGTLTQYSDMVGTFKLSQLQAKLDWSKKNTKPETNSKLSLTEKKDGVAQKLGEDGAKKEEEKKENDKKK